MLRLYDVVKGGLENLVFQESSYLKEFSSLGEKDDEIARFSGG